MYSYDKQYDLIVIGSGPGGLPAAIAAARKGLKTLLIERSSRLGGLLVSGFSVLGFIDRAGNQVVGGIAQEIIDRLANMGGSPGHFKVPICNSMTPINSSWMRILAFEMCEEAGIDILLYSELMDVQVDNGRVVGVAVFCRGEKLNFKTELVIDATGNGDAAYFAGAKYDIDRESLQPASLPFKLGNIDFEKVLAYLEKEPTAYELPSTFPGITQTVEFFRSNRCFPFMGFSNLIEKARAAGDFDIPRNMIDFAREVYPGHASVNVTRAVNTDSTNTNSMIRAEITCHKQVKTVINFLQKYVPGFEHCYLASLAPELGTRESRRIVGKKRLTEDALKNLDIPEDSIAIAGYNVDIHSANNENMTMRTVRHGIGIPYGCLIPDNVDGMLVSGRVISVDKQIFGMSRVMATCMAVGQAAGTAVALSHLHGIIPAEVDVAELRSLLKNDGAIIDLYELG